MKTKILITLLLIPVSILAAEVKLAWDAPAAVPAITNFIIYISTQPITNRATVTRHVGVTNVTATTITNLNYSTIWYFVATSREFNLESAFSNMVNTNTPPLPVPISLRIEP